MTKAKKLKTKVQSTEDLKEELHMLRQDKVEAMMDAVTALALAMDRMDSGQLEFFYDFYMEDRAMFSESSSYEKDKWHMAGRWVVGALLTEQYKNRGEERYATKTGEENFFDSEWCLGYEPQPDVCQDCQKKVA